jgi:hypothetical protein
VNERKEKKRNGKCVIRNEEKSWGDVIFMTGASIILMYISGKWDKGWIDWYFGLDKIDQPLEQMKTQVTIPGKHARWAYYHQRQIHWG